MKPVKPVSGCQGESLPVGLHKDSATLVQSFGVRAGEARNPGTGPLALQSGGGSGKGRSGGWHL